MRSQLKKSNYRFTQRDRYKVVPFAETLYKLDLAETRELDLIECMPYEVYYGNAKHERKEEREKNMPWLNKKNKRFYG